MAPLISRKYEVLSEIGVGGMGVVYKVRHVALDTLLALKMLPADLMRKPEIVRRFNREARMMARLNHPNIVRVIDFDSDESGYYLAMEYIEGKTLWQYVSEEGALPLPEVLEVARQAAGALAFMHNHNPPIIHRDIKPANIMIEGRSQRVVVMDFGIAKELDRAAGQETKIGEFVGTVKYCSPEQLRHEPLDGRADIYALGLVMYELYTGWEFFTGLATNEVIGKVLYDPQEHEPRFARPTPAQFTALLTKAIAKNRQRRYQQIEDLLRDLEACQAALRNPDHSSFNMKERKRILIVEDVELNRDLLVQLLEEDYEILTAADGAVGIELAERELPDLILMDLSLPVVDGWEATRRIKANRALNSIPIIALTAHAMKGDEEKARASGCDDYLTKPINENLLFEKLRH
ncbi:MAG: protein kinase domain-containing protein, partial [Candidatus Binatia bacterium]